MRNLSDLQRALVGFDRFFTTPATTYPPYNVYRKGEDYHIELAVAGFDRQDLSVTLESGELVVSGNRSATTGEEEVTWMVRGLAGRGFRKVFLLEPHHYVDTVKLHQGILTITVMEKVTQPKAIELEIQ
jgi:molecular chaperone IbpA